MKISEMEQKANQIENKVIPVLDSALENCQNLLKDLEVILENKDGLGDVPEELNIRKVQEISDELFLMYSEENEYLEQLVDMIDERKGNLENE